MKSVKENIVLAFCTFLLITLSFAPSANATLPEGDWKPGFAMKSKVKIAGFQIGTESNINFELINCCVTANQNTACNFSNQDSGC